MKRLTLVRHAKAAAGGAECADIDRPLNARGKRDAPMMGTRLAAWGFRPDAVVTSSARRARRTAVLLARELGIPKKTVVERDEIYEAWPATLLRVVRAFDPEWDHVLMVGHNPGLTELAALLCDTVIDDIPTCGVVDLALDAPSWRKVEKGTGRVVFSDAPKREEG